MANPLLQSVIDIPSDVKAKHVFYKHNQLVKEDYQAVIIPRSLPKLVSNLGMDEQE
jgi:hypothetical protein